MAIQLTITNQDGSSRSFDLQNERTTIGRRRSCDLHVALPSVAPLHCEITVEAGLIRLLNRDPDAQTFHNGHPVDSVELENKDVVQVGPVEFQVSIEGDETIIRRL
ncbi:MAG: FHA domain-containing protein [Phycisphaerales bacterium]|jgi:predicted component of type VI protein secretion system|nr:FHA domain-containing protein [Phycisphaerales bacterium]